MQMNPLNNYQLFINFYTVPIQGTGYLLFRDLPYLLNHYAKGKKALDFGCGAGRSSHYLKMMGLEVDGVDINEILLNTAREEFQDINFYPIKNKIIPFQDNLFDVVFNSFVLLDIGTKEQLVAALKEMRRTCKPNGIIISATNSNYLFNKNWLTIDNNFTQNLQLRSGDIAKIYLNDVQIELFDYA